MTIWTNAKKRALLATVFVVQMMFFPASGFATEDVQRDIGGVSRLWPDNLFAIKFADEKHGIVAGESGRVLRTTDGGNSWILSYIGRPELIRRLSYVDPNKVWAVGHRGTIFHSDNGGETWTEQYVAEGTYLRDVSFADSSTGWAVGHGATILHTRDGGANWQRQQITGFAGRDLPRLHGVVALSSDSAVAVGEFGVIAHTENGGELWVTTPVETDVTWTAIDGKQGSLIVVGLDGNAGTLSVADEGQRLAIEAVLRQQAEVEEAKRQRKAKLRKKEYVPQPIDVKLGAVEYVLNQFDTGTTEHLFDVDYSSSGEAVIVGRGLILAHKGSNTVALQASENLPVQFMWFGGISANGAGSFVAVGIRGLLVEGEISAATYSPKLIVAGPISEAITLESTSWNNNHE